ncbi:MAG TPA: hypothetical protein ENI11_00960 [Actinobacteria bacterium]|nr:hypothetical protein [Actinomycetota bacterium]
MTVRRLILVIVGIWLLGSLTLSILDQQRGLEPGMSSKELKRAISSLSSSLATTGTAKRRPIFGDPDVTTSENPQRSQWLRKALGTDGIAKKLKPAKNKTLSGVFESGTRSGQTKFEKSIDAEVAVLSLFQPWSGENNVFPRAWVDQAIDNNKVPLITWEPWSFSQTDFDQPAFRLSTISNGDHDDYIRAWLSEARDWKGPMFVRFAHEMNGNWYPWGNHLNTPADYVAAWRHVVDLSREIGATNITWVWSPNETREQDVLDHFYPGNDYVDWIGVSGFNWPGLEPWQRWRSFSQIYDDFFSQVEKYDKPLMVAEIGVAENARGGPQTRAAWITETLADIRANDPPIALVIWFNDPYTSGGKLYKWQIHESSPSVEAMKTSLADPAFTHNFFNLSEDYAE